MKESNPDNREQATLIYPFPCVDGGRDMCPFLETQEAVNGWLCSGKFKALADGPCPRHHISITTRMRKHVLL